MRELAPLFLVVLLVYLFQCLCWAPPRAVVFSLAAEERKSHRKSGFLWTALKLTGYWCNPLPPLDPVLVVFWPTIQPSPEALRIMQDNGEPAATSWEKLKITRSGTKLLCNGAVIFHGSADELNYHQEFLQKLQQTREKERKKLIEKWLHRATDVATVEKRLASFRNKSFWLELAVNFQFFLLFTMVPLAFFRFGSKALWPSVAALLVISLFIAWRSWRLHKTLFPGDGEARFKSLISTILSPIYAIRAVDALVKELMNGFHPVTVAAVICSDHEFEMLAGEQLRANKFSYAEKNWYQDQLQTVLVQIVEKKGIAAGRLLAAPERERNCVMYCPRCRAQYTKVREACADCGFEHLVEFEQSSTVGIAPSMGQSGPSRS